LIFAPHCTFADGQHDQDYIEWWYFNLFDAVQNIQIIFAYSITWADSGRRGLVGGGNCWFHSGAMGSKNTQPGNGRKVTRPQGPMLSLQPRTFSTFPPPTSNLQRCLSSSISPLSFRPQRSVSSGLPPPTSNLQRFCPTVRLDKPPRSDTIEAFALIVAVEQE